MPNPEPLGEDRQPTHSFHIVRLIRGGNQARVVELLVSDVNMYYVGFRRGVLGDDGVYAYSQWFRMKDLDLPFPHFIQDAQLLDITGGYDASFTLGGFVCLEDMFESHFRHADRPLSRAEQLRVCLRTAFFFGEAFRMWSCFTGAVDMIATGAMVRSIGERSMNRIKSWKVLCVFALETGRRQMGAIDAVELATYEDIYGIMSFDHLIAGVNGELRLLLWNDEIQLDAVMESGLGRHGAHLAVDPGFVAPGTVVVLDDDVTPSDPAYVAPFYRSPAQGFVPPPQPGH